MLVFDHSSAKELKHCNAFLTNSSAYITICTPTKEATSKLRAAKEREGENNGRHFNEVVTRNVKPTLLELI